MPKPINTEKFSAHLRRVSIDVEGQKLLVTNFHGSQQEQDLTEPANCRGLGRVRHFRRDTSPGWPDNPLPIDPACTSLDLGTTDLLRAQVFQNAACNWRCWYCFVDFELLSANPKTSEWVSADDLVGLYLDQPDPPLVLDLSGGQPDLVPEWVPWTMRALRSRGRENEVYLWSDDNLSNDYFWRYLTDADLELITSFPSYGRVCCFKGFDDASFAFNTGAAPDLFEGQFAHFKRLLSLGIDLYAYVTFTTPTASSVADGMKAFVDRLQEIHVNLPLRTVPLEVRAFTPTQGRLTPDHEYATTNQWRAVEAWQRELEDRFPPAERGLPITLVPLATAA